MALWPHFDIMLHCCTQNMMLWKIPVRGVLEGIEGVNLDSLDHEADVVRLPVQVKVC